MDAKQLKELQEKLAESERIKKVITSIQQVKEIYIKKPDVGNIQLLYDVVESIGWGSDEEERNIRKVVNLNAKQLGISQKEFNDIFKDVIFVVLEQFEKNAIDYYDKL